MRLLGLAIVLAACSQDGSTGPMGTSGPQGPEGPQGPQGPPGTSAEGGTTTDDGGKPPPSTGIVWKDSVGINIPIVATVDVVVVGGTFQSFLFYDSASNAVWRYRPDATKWSIGSASGQLVDALDVGYVGSNCTGTSYVIYPPAARYTFTLGTTGANTFYVVPDNVETQQISVGSTNWGPSSGTCTTGTVAFGVPLSMLKTVTKPSMPPGTPPYHPEL
jgi:hypothetical protein